MLAPWYLLYLPMREETSRNKNTTGIMSVSQNVKVGRNQIIERAYTENRRNKKKNMSIS